MVRMNYQKQKLKHRQKKGADSSLITKGTCRAHYALYNKRSRISYNHFSSHHYNIYIRFLKTKS